jgi:nitrogen fixation protein NifB
MNYENHPCFSSGAKHKFGRIHLPVAPKCNMQCNYCDRDFQCVNESRPGVTTAVLTPLQSANYLDAVLNKIQNISVVGIAGPGDPFANASETMETLHIIRKRHPEITLCLATNGLELSKYVDDIAKVNVSHLTVTVNAVNPEVGGSIYAWARFNGRVYRGIDAAALILEKQLKGINMVKEAGITVKINTVVIPGINDNHITDIARLMADMM